MYKSTSGITDISRKLCRTLLKNEQTIPQDTLFRDDLFDETCRKIQNRNETMVIRDIDLLIVFSAQTLTIYDVIHLNHLYETTNEGWNSVFFFSLHKTRPQLDFSVGFGRSAFTQKQWNKLKPFVGELGFKIIIYFMITTRMYFLFLTCEVKCGAAAFDIADRQNAHSMSVALKAFVILFKSVKREKQFDRKIFTFFISHNHRSVKMYDHYPVIEGDKTIFYRHSIREFSFTEQDEKKKWTAYRFIKNVYDHHSLKLHAMICSAINDLSLDINFDFSQSVFFSQSTSQSSQQSNAEFIVDEDDTQLSSADSQKITSSTSFIQTNESAFKKPKNQRAGRQWRWCVKRICHDFDELDLYVRMRKPIEAILEEFRLIIADYYQSVKVHVEIKFFFLYELNPGRLRPRIICFNKSACYFCNPFFKFYGRFYVFRTHGRLYHKWTLSDWHILVLEMRRFNFDVFSKRFSDVLKNRIAFKQWFSESSVFFKKLDSMSDELSNGFLHYITSNESRFRISFELLHWLFKTFESCFLKDLWYFFKLRSLAHTWFDYVLKLNQKH